MSKIPFYQAIPDSSPPPAPAQRGPCDQPGCKGWGVVGNENVVDGKTECDYCSASRAASPAREATPPEPGLDPLEWWPKYAAGLRSRLAASEATVAALTTDNENLELSRDRWEAEATARVAELNELKYSMEDAAARYHERD